MVQTASPRHACITVPTGNGHTVLQRKPKRPDRNERSSCPHDLGERVVHNSKERSANRRRSRLPSKRSACRLGGSDHACGSYIDSKVYRDSDCSSRSGIAMHRSRSAYRRDQRMSSIGISSQGPCHVSRGPLLKPALVGLDQYGRVSGTLAWLLTIVLLPRPGGEPGRH